MKYSINYLITKSLKKLGLSFSPADCTAVTSMQDTISGLGNSGIQFSISKEPNGDWVAESINLPGIITGGTAQDQIDEMIKDAIFTYFGVPAKYCDDRLLRSAGEPTITKQQIFLTPAKA